MNNNPLVSAIVSTYNSEKFIRNKIEDLLAQSIVDKLEIIIVNSGSKQNEDAIVKEFLVSHTNIKYIHTEHRETIYKAWNRGIKISTGQFITSSNTDDRLRFDALKILSNTLMNDPDLCMVYADQYLSNIPNQFYRDATKNKIIEFPDYSYIYQLERCIIGSQPMWRASLHFDEDIWFNEKYEVCGDHEFELNISRKGKVLHIPIVLGTFYKALDKSNKATENLKCTGEEVNEITNFYLDDFFGSLNRETIERLIKDFSRYLKIPVPIYIILKRFDRLIMRNIYPKLFIHSIEFVYYFSISLFALLGKNEEAIKYCKKYLRYKSSIRIKNKFTSLTHSL